jgi:hypothetical protein
VPAELILTIYDYYGKRSIKIERPLSLPDCKTIERFIRHFGDYNIGFSFGFSLATWEFTRIVERSCGDEPFLALIRHPVFMRILKQFVSTELSKVCPQQGSRMHPGAECLADLLDALRISSATIPIPELTNFSSESYKTFRSKLRVGRFG